MSPLDTKNEIDKADIDSLVETLNSNDGLARQHARATLVKIGRPALDPLIAAFEIKEEPIHWEVAKTLSQIGTSRAAETLVGALEDKNFGVRWIAAEGLIHIGSTGLIPLLEALEKKSDSIWMREGCHHIIHDLINRKLIDDRTAECVAPVLEAINHLEASTETIYAAAKALQALETKEQSNKE